MCMLIYVFNVHVLRVSLQEIAAKLFIYLCGDLWEIIRRTYQIFKEMLAVIVQCCLSNGG